MNYLDIWKATWDFVYDKIKNQLHCKEDVAVALIHHHLIIKEFECLGLKNTENNVGSGELPTNWNSNSKLYELKYVRDALDYFLTVERKDDYIMDVELKIHRPTSIGNMSFNVNSYILRREGDLLAMVPKFAEILEKINKMVRTLTSAYRDSNSPLTLTSNVRPGAPRSSPTSSDISNGSGDTHASGYDGSHRYRKKTSQNLRKSILLRNYKNVKKNISSDTDSNFC